MPADALADLFARDALYEFPFLAPQRGVQRYEGREAIRSGFTAAWGTLASSPVQAIRVLAVHDTTDPSIIIGEHEYDAVDPETGRSWTTRFLIVLQAQEGEIVALRDYVDTLSVAQGLGRLPALLNALNPWA
jgi:uncharacterized protein